MDKSFLRYREAAALLGISELTLRRKVMLRQVPVLKPFGPRGRVLFAETDLLAMLERSRVPALVESKKGSGRAAGAVA
jgi:excisionase family DNA binding protein